MENVIQKRLKSGGNRLLSGLANALYFGGTGQMLPQSKTQEDDSLEQALKMQRLQTGSPEFQMQLAQTKADIAAQQAMELEEAKIAQAAQRRKIAEADQNYVLPTQSANNGLPAFLQEPGTESYDPATGMMVQKPGNFSPNPAYQEQQKIDANQQRFKQAANGPSATMTGAIAPRNIPSFGDESLAPKSSPRFIQVPKTPPTRKYDPSIGMFVDVPAEFGYDLDPAYKAQQDAEAAGMKKMAEMKAKQDDFKQALNAFKSVGNVIPRKFGTERFTQGFENIRARTLQEQGDPLASASATYEGARKNLRVAVARIKDVGNLSETEQKAAEMLVPSDMDSPEVYETKVAYLEALAGASSPDDIKMIINSFSGGQLLPNNEPEVASLPTKGKYKIVSIE